MQAWQQKMTQGNRFYQQQKWSQAINCYYRAINLLENALTTEQPQQIQQVIEGLVCGYHNIAETYLQQGHIEGYRNNLIIPLRYLLSLVTHPETRTDIKLISRNTIKVALLPLFEFANEHPSELVQINNLIQQLNTNNQITQSLH